MREDSQEKNNTRLKVGLIVDSFFSTKYVYEIARWANEQKELEQCKLIIQKIEKEPKGFSSRIIYILRRHSLIVSLRKLTHHAIKICEYHLLRKNVYHKDHMHKYDLRNQVKNYIEVEPNVSSSGLVYRYTETDLEKVSNENFDVLIRCGSGIIRGSILSITKFGVLSFHHADNKINRGGPPGFWEVLNKENSSGFTIQKLTDELDGGEVLFRGNLSTKNYYMLNQANIYNKSNYYMKKILLELAQKRSLPKKIDSFPYYNQLYKLPSIRNQLIYIFSLSILMVKKLTEKHILGRVSRWGVSYNFSNWRDLVMWKAKKIDNPPNRFLADPFVVKKDNKHFCFVEDYDYSISRGCISLYELTYQGAIRHGEIIKENFHMSYPYVFKYDSNYYMVPETSENRDIRLYKAKEFPFEWKFIKTIFNDIDATDTTIFKYGDYWWLMTNIDPVNSREHGSELFLFFSDNPLSGSWQPHPKNPVICDSSKGRMGGIVFENDEVFRISQMQGFDVYGKASIVNRICTLSVNDYKEESEFMIEPNFLENIIGTHHLHSNGEVTVFDYVKKSRKS